MALAIDAQEGADPMASRPLMSYRKKIRSKHGRRREARGREGGVENNDGVGLGVARSEKAVEEIIKKNMQFTSD